jgi:hypothetical protein
VLIGQGVLILPPGELGLEAERCGDRDPTLRGERG